MQSVLQSGTVTPGHLTSWVTDGVIADAGVTYSNSFGILQATALSINFNAAGETQILVNLPEGYTRYRISSIIVSGATGTLVGATCGVWTGSAQSGVMVVASGTALTVNTSLTDTNNNMQKFAIVNQDTMAYSDPALYFRVLTPQGSPALANVTVRYEPLP